VVVVCIQERGYQRVSAWLVSVVSVLIRECHGEDIGEPRMLVEHIIRMCPRACDGSVFGMACSLKLPAQRRS
jgi:hypothetical protein